MMNGYRSNGLNQVWIGIVLIHVIGSLFLVLMMGIPAGLLVINSSLWVYSAYANRKKKGAIFLSAVGWSCTLYLMTHVPITYSSAFALNMLLFLYVFYLHYGSVSLLISENHIKRLKGKDIGYILLFTILLIIIGGFVNACSMYVFHNYVSSSLIGVSDYMLGGVLVFAFAPALVEELLFRGFIFQRLGKGMTTILLSSMLFSLCHMNFNQMCYAFVIGLFLAVILQKSDNLMISMCVHLLFNLYAIICTAYENNWFIQKILSIQVGGYHIFNASIVDSNGNLMVGVLVAGVVCFALAIILLMAVLSTLKMESIVANGEGDNWKKEKNWKPDIPFLLGVAICLLVAILHEISV